MSGVEYMQSMFVCVEACTCCVWDMQIIYVCGSMYMWNVQRPGASSYTSVGVGILIKFSIVCSVCAKCIDNSVNERGVRYAV